MNNKLELITNIKGVNFYKGAIIDNGLNKEVVIITDEENYRVDVDEDILKACARIYTLWFE